MPETVLGVPGPFETVEAGRRHPDPMELRIKEVRFGRHGKGSRRYVLCHNQEQAAKDAATRAELLDTRPVFHRTDATICGHVFCSFLALLLRDALSPDGARRGDGRVSRHPTRPDRVDGNRHRA